LKQVMAKRRFGRAPDCIPKDSAENRLISRLNGLRLNGLFILGDVSVSSPEALF